jgi:hypothetical protein
MNYFFIKHNAKKMKIKKEILWKEKKKKLKDFKKRHLQTIKFNYFIFQLRALI